MDHHVPDYGDSLVRTIHRIGPNNHRDMNIARSKWQAGRPYHDLPFVIQRRPRRLRQALNMFHEFWWPSNCSESKWIRVTFGSVATSIRHSRANGMHTRATLDRAYCDLVRISATKCDCRLLPKWHQSAMDSVQLVRPIANGISADDCTMHVDRPRNDPAPRSRWIRCLWPICRCSGWIDCIWCPEDDCIRRRLSTVLCACWNSTSSRRLNSRQHFDTRICDRSRSTACNRIYSPNPNWRIPVCTPCIAVLRHYLCTGTFRSLCHTTAYCRESLLDRSHTVGIRAHRNYSNWHRIDRICRPSRPAYIDTSLRYYIATNANRLYRNRNEHNNRPIASRSFLCNAHNLVRHDLPHSPNNGHRDRSNCTSSCRRSIYSRIRCSCKLKWKEIENKWSRGIPFSPLDSVATQTTDIHHPFTTLNDVRAHEEGK